MVKVCKKCGSVWGANDKRCKPCHLETKRKWRLRNKEHISEYSRRWSVDNREARTIYKRELKARDREKWLNYSRNYYQENKEALKEYQMNRFKTGEGQAYWKARRKDNKKCRIAHRMSTSIRTALQGKKRGHKWELLVGYTADELIEHFEALFTNGMHWGNMDEWHIDHIMPKSTFDYNSYNDDSFKKCWAMENLQPLWAEDNLKKSNRLDYKINRRN